MDCREKGNLFRFRKWPVYQSAKAFRCKIRKLAKTFPGSERFLLRDQMSRAADSICLNIAEGSNKLSDLEFSRYLNNASTSLEEVVCCMDLGMEDGYLSQKEFDGYQKEAEGLGSQLIAFGKKVRQDAHRF